MTALVRLLVGSVCYTPPLLFVCRTELGMAEAGFTLADSTVDESSLAAAFDCEESAGELPTRALSDALIFQVSGETLTLCDLEVLDGDSPSPVDVVGRLTKIDKVMDPVQGAELGPNVRLSGVTDWSVEYDALSATVWVSTATADYKLVRPAPAYATLWESLERKTLLSARSIALITEHSTGWTSHGTQGRLGTSLPLGTSLSWPRPALASPPPPRQPPTARARRLATPGRRASPSAS